MRRAPLLFLLAACSSAPVARSTAGDDGGAPGAGDAQSPLPEASGGDAGALDGDSPAPDAGHRGDASLDAAPSPPPPPAAFLTTDDLTRALAPVALTVGAGDAGATLTVDPATSFQSIVGFGASLTDSSSYVLTAHLSAGALHDVLVRLFDPEGGIGLSFLRQPMGASDFSSAGDFSYDDGNADPMLAGFDVAQDRKATIPVLQQALALAPGLFVIGTPWSPPGWMKKNGSMDGTGGAGGNAGLAGDAYAPLGQYFVKFVQAYAAAGIPVAAVTPQNEPLNGAATYPGMDLNAPSELALIAQDIGPAFAAAGLATEIWAYDHNWDVETYPEQIVADPTAGPLTEGAAFHCYGGDASAMTTFHQNHPDKSVYMTECSGGGWQNDAFANTIDLALDSTANWARVVSLWNLALDENAGPQNHGCSDCRGVVTVNGQTGQVTYNADYFALGHFSRFVRPGAVRIASSSSLGDLKQVAFRNLDGRIAVVMHNTGAASVHLQIGAGTSSLAVDVPANAAVTVSWTP